MKIRTYVSPRTQQVQAQEAQQAFRRWTAPAGTLVDVTRDGGMVFRTRTRSMPWLVDGWTPVILVDGIAGNCLLTRVKVVERAPLAASVATP